ncbi:MAG: hypothetical protein WAW79_07570 [Steroidobacteraceae bacterium]
MTASLVASAQAPQGQAPPTPQQRVAMLKQWLQASQAQLRNYEWVETTVISKGGEEKSRKQNTCYYGVDGKLQKVPAAAAAADSGGGGRLKQRIVARKKEEIADYMKSAAELVHAYVPPDSNRIQQSVNAGKMSMSPQDGGRRVQLVFKDYLKAGDSLSVDIETATNRLLGMNIASYLDDSTADAIQLDVAMGLLPDGTIYTAKSSLAAPAKDLTVVIENAGYRRSTH